MKGRFSPFCPVTLYFITRIFGCSLKVDEFLRPGPPEGKDDARVVNGARVGAVVVAGGRGHRWIVVA